MTKRVSKTYGPAVAGSIRDLARKVDRNESAIRKWMKREDWEFGKKGPWKVKDIKEWMEDYLDEEAVVASKKSAKKKADLGPLTKARKEAAEERTLLTRQRRLVESGDLISKKAVQARDLRKIQAVKSALLALPRSIANAIVDKPKDEVAQVVQKREEDIIRRFAKGK